MKGLHSEADLMPNTCVQVLGQGAVHGAFAGFTGFTVGLVNTHYVYLPIPVIIQDTRKVDPKVKSPPSTVPYVAANWKTGSRLKLKQAWRECSTL